MSTWFFVGGCVDAYAKGREAEAMSGERTGPQGQESRAHLRTIMYMYLTYAFMQRTMFCILH